MSYTMTLDMPQKEASYAARHSARFNQELNAIALVIVRSQMEYDMGSSGMDLDFVADWGRFRIPEGELDLSREETPLRAVDFE